MDVSLDLLLNAIISGLLLGGFYAAVSIGVAIAFGRQYARTGRGCLEPFSAARYDRLALM